MKEVTIVLNTQEGLHARPAGIFAKAAANVKSNIKVYKNGDLKTAYNPKSILSVLSMGAQKGDKLTLVLEGEDEETAILELKNLLESNLDE
jgi:phosphotransferase system HPr (HPr) family protein